MYFNLDKSITFCTKGNLPGRLGRACWPFQARGAVRWTGFNPLESPCCSENQVQLAREKRCLVGWGSCSWRGVSLGPPPLPFTVSGLLGPKAKLYDFPGGPGAKNPPSNAGEVGLILGGGTKIPQAVGQLSL